jgi:hypothetical protein
MPDGHRDCEQARRQEGSMTTITLDNTTVGTDDLERGTRKAWAEALADPKVRSWLEDQGVDSAELADAAISVRHPDDIGVDSLGAIAIDIAKAVAGGVILELFRAFILPKLKERFGADAVGEVVSTGKQ